MNKPTGTHAANALVNTLQDLLRDYDAMRALRDRTEPSLPKYDSIERRLAGMRRQATKLINELNQSANTSRADATPPCTSWQRAFGMV